MNDDQRSAPESLLPYDAWTQDSLRLVVARALAFVAHNGLPGEHHFYLTFRTDAPGVEIPTRLRAQYPQEMTIVLQHQFDGLAVDDVERRFTVRLHFSGVPATLSIPFDAIVGFADPHVRFGLRFEPVGDPTEAHIREQSTEPAESREDPAVEGEVVSLDAFRRRSPGKE